MQLCYNLTAECYNYIDVLYRDVPIDKCVCVCYNVRTINREAHVKRKEQTMKKTIRDIQKDVCTLEDVIFETTRTHEDDVVLLAFNEEFEFFLFANREDDEEKYEDTVENQYLGSIDTDDVKIRRYFMHTFISFLTIFFRMFQYYLLDEKREFTETGNIIKQMYNEYLEYEIE